MTLTCYFCATPTPTDTCPQCQQPQVLRGTYRMLRVLGQGGFGVVYQARDTRFERLYAIKVIHSLSAADQRLVQSESDIMARYARQFTFMPEIYDQWTEGSRTYLVMEYIAGQTLGQLLTQQQRLSSKGAYEVLHKLLEHLHELHQAGIVHRDIKPDNITFTPEGRYVLLDFGISKQHAMTMTAAKAISPHYSSPEQSIGQPTDARSDLYSLGATVYHLLTGLVPPPATLRLAQQVPVIPPNQRNPDIDYALHDTILALLELDPDQRPDSAQAALNLLKQPLSTAPLRRTQPLASPTSTPVRAVPVPRSRVKRHQETKPQVILSFTIFICIIVISCAQLGIDKQDLLNSGVRSSSSSNFSNRVPPPTEDIRLTMEAIAANDHVPLLVNPLMMSLEWQDGEHDMRYAILADTDTSKIVEAGSLATVEYQLYDHTGTDVDRDSFGVTQSIPVGNLQATAELRSLTPGFDLGIRGMSVGDKRVLEVPAALAFANADPAQVPEGIDPQQRVFYIVEVMRIQ